MHDLQNHDEITYQLVELDARSDQVFRLNGREFSGRQLLDALSGAVEAAVTTDNRCEIRIERLTGKTLILAR